MANLFLITSTINVSLGLFNYEERFYQTLATIYSIRSHDPTAIIVLIDSSINGIGGHYTKKLLKQVNYFIDMSSDKILNDITVIGSTDVVDLHGNASPDPDICSIKSLSEMRILIYFLSSCIVHPELLNNITRVFKISGRYWLSGDFNINDYDYSTNDRFVFKTKETSTVLHHPLYDYELTGGIFYQYNTRLWSFDVSLLIETFNMFQLMFNDMINILSNKKFIDLEHSIYKFIDKKKVIEFDTIGLAGLWGPNGSLIIE